MIKFKVIRWQNFLSTGAQFTEVKFDKSPTTLIVGENGAGKSTILDALCFALFNKPFRNINKPQLVNAINGKNMLVEVEFSIGSKEYKICRGGKPTVFEIYLNSELLNQDAAARDYQKYLEDQVLKLNYKSFTQIVILGSASFTPFMQLPAAHRREVIEDLLDIKIFTVMNTVLKDKASDIKVKITDLENKIDLGKSKVKIQQDYIKTLEEDKQKKVEDVQKRISESNAEIAHLQRSVEEECSGANLLQSSIVDNTEKRTKRTELDALLRKLSERIKTQEKHVSFYDEHDVCPTCNQALEAEVKENAKTAHQHKIGEIETAVQTLTEQLDAIETRLDEITLVEEKIAEHKSNIISLTPESLPVRITFKSSTKTSLLLDRVYRSLLKSKPSSKQLLKRWSFIQKQRVRWLKRGITLKLPPYSSRIRESRRRLLNNIFRSSTNSLTSISRRWTFLSRLR